MEAGADKGREPGLGGRYLVAVSGSGNSEYLVRWTEAAARRLDAEWTAVHVRGPRPEPDPAALERNLALASGLGAEVVSVQDDDVAASIIRHARMLKATALVIGKADEAPAQFLGRRSLTEEIVRESGDLDLIVLRGENPVPLPKRRRGRPLPPPRLRDALVALGALAAVTALGLVARPALGYRSISILYLLAIISLPFACGRRTVIAAAALSALLWNFVFIPPQLTFSIGSLEDLLMFAAFFLAAFAGGIMTSRLREKEAALSLRERRTALLYGFTQSLTRVRGVEEIASLGSAFAAEHLGAGVGFWLRGPDGKLESGKVLRTNARTARRADPDPAAARTAFTMNAAVEDGAACLYLPLRAPDSVIGVAFAEGKGREPFRGESRELLATLAGNMALAFERELLAAANEEHKLLDESARLSRVLLNHVSHELRTPLTTIKGSVSGLLDGSADEDPLFRKELLGETLKAADKLNALVEDLLSMSRLETGSLRLRRERTGLCELLAAAQGSLAEELAGRTVRTGSSCADAEFEVDPALMVQVFRNILRNFAAYTPVGSVLEVSVATGWDHFGVSFSDDGPGVPLHELPSLFDTFYRGSNGARTQGSGLGLSICKGIVEAHGGTVAARPSASGGLEIALKVPRKP
ncbi:MAG: DUF4118 domain-containing protein [Spirochaetales bacterium]|nr:DUF4118 domain-containing protein [Spirochaetales bacterium]